ncbi:hypothetical protein [Aliterella atlantica]|uniref:hypothetical protein n=1 Tax=Aliterella atlantica TaxID=1827278 RepID=UPI0013648AD2|nr:hypothetical protein [Aliterella atlantica]
MSVKSSDYSPITQEILNNLGCGELYFSKAARAIAFNWRYIALLPSLNLSFAFKQM